MQKDYQASIPHEVTFQDRWQLLQVNFHSRNKIMRISANVA
jgi:hypothetical protein